MQPVLTALRAEMGDEFISPFPTFSESTIKTVLNQSDKKTECFRQRKKSPQKRAQYQMCVLLGFCVQGLTKMSRTQVRGKSCL
jgi:hypothetical protein